MSSSSTTMTVEEKTSVDDVLVTLFSNLRVSDSQMPLSSDHRCPAGKVGFKFSSHYNKTKMLKSSKENKKKPSVTELSRQRLLENKRSSSWGVVGYVMLCLLFATAITLSAFLLETTPQTFL
jgi:hypothetical protein